MFLCIITTHKKKTLCITLSKKILNFHMHYTGRKNCFGLHTQPMIIWYIQYIFHVTFGLNDICVLTHEYDIYCKEKQFIYLCYLCYISFLTLPVQLYRLKVLTIHDAGLLLLTCNVPPLAHAWQFDGIQPQHVSVAEIQELNQKMDRCDLATQCSGTGKFVFLL